MARMLNVELQEDVYESLLGMAKKAGRSLEALASERLTTFVRRPTAEARQGSKAHGTTEDLKRVLKEVQLREDTLDAIEDVVRSRGESPMRLLTWDHDS